MTATAVSEPISADPLDPINATILSVSEDRVHGFSLDPFGEIARLSGVPFETVCARIRAMLVAGAIRRVRQTLITNNLADGALVAWRVPEERLNDAFDFLFREDPFSGHVVLRSTDPGAAGAAYRLWTTLKVPAGLSLDRHCRALAKRIGAEAFLLMPAKGIFALGVGHTRRRSLEPGSRDDAPAKMIQPEIVRLDESQWRVLMALKREFDPSEIGPDPWRARAAEAGVDLGRFVETVRFFEENRILGRFSTFLEHHKPLPTGERVTRFNGLFHWAVPPGREIEAGGEVGRHHVMTHCYWREGGPEFRDVNIMGVAHGTERDRVLAHKEAIDRHLAEAGIPVSYTNVFWGGRSEIKPSELSPFGYADWLARMEAPE
jgi:DNA-binding Lrp family transcriptional regulator